MKVTKYWAIIIGKWLLASCLLLSIPLQAAWGSDLPEIKKRGVLRHLGVPYAEFVIGGGIGLDAALIMRFAAHLGVRYEYVETSWKRVIGDLTGKQVRPMGTDVKVLGSVPVRGDIIANGLTILPWREKVLNFSSPTFPSGVWLITQADSAMQPIIPSGKVQVDISAVKSLLRDLTVFTMKNSCLDPDLHNIYATGAEVLQFNRQVNELAPAIINRKAQAGLLDVPDVLVALEKWPGKIKVIGPISPTQEMGWGFAKESPLLRQAFNAFFETCKKDGSYRKLVQTHYPSVFDYFPEFFEKYGI